MGHTPKYRQVVDWIRGRLASGELKKGDRLETESALSERFRFSRQTVRQALAELEQDGTILRIQGSGSYVQKGMEAKPAPEAALSARSVTILSSYVDSYIFPRILSAIAGELQEQGYAANIMFTNNRHETEREILSRIVESGQTDPLIAEPVASSLPNRNLDYYRTLQERGVPIIFFNTYYPELDIPHISLDDRAVGALAAEHLITLGHRRIGAIFKNDDGQGARRFLGYQEALEQAGLALSEEHVCWIDTHSMRERLRGDARILRRLEGCTACVCYNDEVANMLTELCAEAGIRIPEDLSLVSVDDTRLAMLNPVPLTSVVHPMEKLGRKLGEHLIRLLQEPGFDATYEFPPDLTVRESAVRPGGEQEPFAPLSGLVLGTGGAGR